jgi:hypothetical protein
MTPGGGSTCQRKGVAGARASAAERVGTRVRLRSLLGRPKKAISAREPKEGEQRGSGRAVLATLRERRGNAHLDLRKARGSGGLVGPMGQKPRRGGE